MKCDVVVGFFGKVAEVKSCWKDHVLVSLQHNMYRQKRLQNNKRPSKA